MKAEDEKMVRVTIRMPAAQRDRLAKQAEKSGVSMAEYVRSLLAKRVPAMEPPNELWPLLENQYGIRDILLRIRKPEFIEAARRLEQTVLDLQSTSSARRPRRTGTTSPPTTVWRRPRWSR